jgi:inhibitor of KinA sporulation pathway (predicted exonuclease)
MVAFFCFSEIGFATDGQQHPGLGDAATASKAVEVIQ